MFLRIFIYKGTKMKLGSVCRADQMQFNGPTLRSQTNFYGEKYINHKQATHRVH